MSSTLIERLEKATGPDAEIDYAIGEWLYMQGRQPWECFNYGKDGPTIKFTDSIDAALTLVPLDKFDWDLCNHDGLDRTKAVAWLWPLEGTFEQKYRGATPAIAICIAALKARRISSGERS